MNTSPFQSNSDGYLMSIALEVATQCTCRRRPVGAVIVRDGHIIASGYNTTMTGLKSCLEGSCPRCADPLMRTGEHLDRCICVHAEQNALINAARFGVAVEGADCYVTSEPCLDCTKSLIQARIKQVTYWQPYSMPAVQSLRQHLREAAAPRTLFIPWQPGASTSESRFDSRFDEIVKQLKAYVDYINSSG